MDYDLIIIGSGWAGFNAAQRARRRGLKVCLLEKAQLGGTCLNRGCIPTKALIHSARIYSLCRKSNNFGIENSDPRINFSAIQQRKQTIIRQLKSGMESMLKGIDFLNGEAKILSAHSLEVGGRILKTKFILLAVGSKSVELRSLRFDRQKIISSDELLEIKEVPRSLLIVGGGVAGCEFANLFSLLGTRVEIIEKMPQLLPGHDLDIAKKIEGALKKRAVKVNLSSDADNIDLSGYELVLLSVGRVPVTHNLGLDEVGIRLEKGAIAVDSYMRTNIDNIYAAGDCTGGIMLAHYAGYQGSLAVDNLLNHGGPQRVDDIPIPVCIFTDPEAACVGLREEDAKNRNQDIIVHKFDLMGSGMARILGEREGFIKIISEDKIGRILGASIFGTKASELIGLFSLAINCGLTVKQIENSIFPHPTISESITEALREN